MKFEFLKNLPKGPYEGVDLSDWGNWQWQLKHALKNMRDFSQVYDLTDEERGGFENSQGLFKIRTTPYYAVLGERTESQDPIRLIQTPSVRETEVRFQQMDDPLGENKNSATPRLVHRYSDRVLFLVTDFCSVYCRFCTRKRFTGLDQSFASAQDYTASLDYIRSHEEIREVILSGGDPLTLSDDRLHDILRDLRSIPHIEIIRIGSRMPNVNPFRLTDSLLSTLKKFKPVYLMTHFNHPRELTLEVAEALERTADSGVPLMNQMVMLNGINNHPAIVQALSRRLLYLRVKPYYMFQCDPSKGSDHHRTSIVDSLEIQRELWGHLSGLAMPNFSIDIPQGGGKTSMTPNFLLSQHEVNNSLIWKFRGFDGVESEYIDPSPTFIRKPKDAHLYQTELDLLKN